MRRGQDDPSGQRHVDQDLHQRDTAQLDHIAEHETHAKSDNPDLQPEFIGLDAGAENSVQANGVGDEQAEDDRPQYVLDVRHPPMLLMCKRIPPDLGVLTKQADRDQQQDSRHVVQDVAAGETRLVRGLGLLGNHRAHRVTTESWAAVRPRPTAPRFRPRSSPTSRDLSVPGAQPSLVRHRRRSRSPQSP